MPDGRLKFEKIRAMPQLFFSHAGPSLPPLLSSASPRWECVLLPVGRAVCLGAQGLSIHSACGSGSAEWVLLAAPDSRVSVNSEDAAVTGIRVLRHKDMICAEGLRLFFSGEKIAAVSALEAADVHCARCQSEMQTGTPVLLCPECGAPHHAEGCWDAAPACALCPRPTNARGLLWSPVEGGWS